MPKFKARWIQQYNHKTKANEPRVADSAGEVVKFDIDATDSERGELEDMRDRINKLGCILAAVVDTLPREAQVQVVGAICGWDEVEGS